MKIVKPNTPMRGWPNGTKCKTASDQSICREEAVRKGYCGTLMAHGRICVEYSGECPVHIKEVKIVKNMYVVEVYGGYMGMLKCKTIKTAEKRALKEHGTRNLDRVREATQEDIDHFVGMGGKLPQWGED